MSEILVLDADDIDDDRHVERVIAENARDRGEDDWTIEGTETNDGELFVRVTWASETDQLFTIEERAAITDEDRYKLEMLLENNNYIFERTDAGRWRVFRGGYEG